MSRHIVLSEIRALIESLKEQQEQISQHADSIPRIETDIMMGNVRKLYEMLHLLTKESATPISEPASEPITQVFTHSEPLVIPQPEIAANKIVEPEPEISFVPEPVNIKPEISEPTELFSELVTPEPEELMQPEVIIANAEQPVPVEVNIAVEEQEAARPSVTAARKKSFLATASLFDEAPSVGATIAAQPTVYDKISSSAEDSSLSTRMQSDPVSDLRKSIGINEKFSFINELFDGDLDGYNRVIEQLNTCDGIAAALSLLEGSYIQQYSWQTHGKAYLNLRRLVERRYS